MPAFRRNALFSLKIDIFGIDHAALFRRPCGTQAILDLRPGDKSPGYSHVFLRDALQPDLLTSFRTRKKFTLRKLSGKQLAGSIHKQEYLSRDLVRSFSKAGCSPPGW